MQLPAITDPFLGQTTTFVLLDLGQRIKVNDFPNNNIHAIFDIDIVPDEQ